MIKENNNSDCKSFLKIRKKKIALIFLHFGKPVYFFTLQRNVMLMLTGERGALLFFYKPIKLILLKLICQVNVEETLQMVQNVLEGSCLLRHGDALGFLRRRWRVLLESRICALSSWTICCHKSTCIKG